MRIKNNILKIIIAIIISLLSISILLPQSLAQNEENTNNNSEQGTMKDSSTYNLQVTVVNPNEEYSLYILLPKSYIEYAIDNANMDIKYNKAETLKENKIPGIDVLLGNVQDKVYEEENVEYVQIKLYGSSDVYTFDLLSGYPQKDVKLRLKSDTKDYILHMDNFTINNNECNIEYNYETDSFQNLVEEDKTNKFSIQPWQIAVVVVIIIIIAVITKKLNK